MNLLVSVVFALLALQVGQSGRLAENVAAADSIVYGTVRSVRALKASTVEGDRIIISQVELNVLETLKGTPARAIWVEVVGGTVDGMTMESSSQSRAVIGERAIVLSAKGRALPYGWTRLDVKDRAVGKGPSLEDVRQAVKGAK